ncbi:MAG: CaiB/BaiF CoA-transferase family protein [Pseudomonadota bacterium]
MGPLNGLKIIEVKGLGPGPYAGMLLADLGADVIVIERSGAPGIAPPAERDVFSRGKRRLSLDLKSSNGIQVLKLLAQQADALIEGFRPGVMERLGVGPDALHDLNPKLVYGRMTGWGQTGPLSQRAGHDINYIALTGALHAIGERDTPLPPLNLVGDFAGGSLFLVTGVLAALWEARVSGQGQVVDAAISDGSAHLMSLFYTLSELGMWTTIRQRNMLDGGAPFYRVYATQDERFVAVGALEPAFFAQLLEGTGLPSDFAHHQHNPSKWPELKAAFETVFKTRTRDEWVAVFEQTDACVTPVLDLHEALNHAHNAARDTYVTVDGVDQPAPAPRFSRTACAAPTSPASLGDLRHTLSAWGVSESALSAFESEREP